MVVLLHIRKWGQTPLRGASPIVAQQHQWTHAAGETVGRRNGERIPAQNGSLRMLNLLL